MNLLCVNLGCWWIICGTSVHVFACMLDRSCNHLPTQAKDAGSCELEKK